MAVLHTSLVNNKNVNKLAASYWLGCWNCLYRWLRNHTRNQLESVLLCNVFKTDQKHKEHVKKTALECFIIYIRHKSKLSAFVCHPTTRNCGGWIWAWNIHYQVNITMKIVLHHNFKLFKNKTLHLNVFFVCFSDFYFKAWTIINCSWLITAL